MHCEDARSGDGYEPCPNNTKAHVVGVYLGIRISGLEDRLLAGGWQGLL